MPDYSRFISYLFHFDRDGKRTNAGHARIEVRQEICKISIHIKLKESLYLEQEVLYYARGHENGGNIKTVKLGSISIMRGEGTAVFETNVHNMNHSGISFMNINGIIIFKDEKDGYTTADWEEKELTKEQAQSIFNKDKIKDLNETTEEEKFIFDFLLKDSYTDEGNIINSLPEHKDNAVREESVDLYKQSDTSIKAEAAVKPQIPVNPETAIKPEMTVKPEMAARPEEVILKPAKAAYLDTADYDDVMIMNSVTSMPQSINFDYKQEDEASAEDTLKKAVSAAEAAQIIPAAKSRDTASYDTASYEIASSGTKQENTKHSNINISDEFMEKNLFGKRMPWQDPKEAREILDANERMYPFQDGEIAECVKIEPKDIGKLPVEFWVLGNNSFLLHSYCNYKYLLFAKRMNRIKCEYLLMVPGVYQHREKVMAKMFGFEHFKCVRYREQRVGEFGYWYMSISF